MSRQYFKPFTHKKHFFAVFLALLGFVFSNHAFAIEDPKITGRLYVAKKDEPGKYSEKIQWQITSVGEWSKFLVNLKNLTKDEEKANPMQLKQDEIIHFSVINEDKKTGHDIYLSKSGIQQYAKMPKDTIYVANASFRSFLEEELKRNPSYDKINTEPDINSPGIVVIYRGSQQLKNPYWVINMSDAETIAKYLSYGSYFQISGAADKVDNNSFELPGSFIIYYNFTDAPYDIATVSPDGAIRTTQIDKQYHYYKDDLGYFPIFKRQAEDNYKAALKSQEDPGKRRRLEAARGQLF
jgi:hypothetical protein